MAVILVYWIIRNFQSGKIISPLPNPPNLLSRLFSGSFRREKNPEELRKIIIKTVDDGWKNYSVLVVDLNSGFRSGINDTVIYTAASVNKVAILAVLYDQYRKGLADPDRSITLQQHDIQDYGTGSIRYDKPGTTYSVKTLSMLMMRKSDNTAAFLLANYVITIPVIQDTINSWGLTQTDIVNNKTSNADMAILFRKIFHGEIANPAYTKEMLSLMQDSDFEDRLPARLPTGTAVYHKIGSEIGVIHDAGIVNTGDRQYYIGVFTGDITDEKAATEKIAELSRQVYDFMK